MGKYEGEGGREGGEADLHECTCNRLGKLTIYYLWNCSTKLKRKHNPLLETQTAGRATLLVRMAARLMLSSSTLSFTERSRPSAGATSTESTPAPFAAVSQPEQIALNDTKHSKEEKKQVKKKEKKRKQRNIRTNKQTKNMTRVQYIYVYVSHASCSEQKHGSL